MRSICSVLCSQKCSIATLKFGDLGAEEGVGELGELVGLADAGLEDGARRRGGFRGRRGRGRRGGRGAGDQ
jgi:hypothetical protein